VKKRTITASLDWPTDRHSLLAHGRSARLAASLGRLRQSRVTRRTELAFQQRIRCCAPRSGYLPISSCSCNRPRYTRHLSNSSTRITGACGTAASPNGRGSWHAGQLRAGGCQLASATADRRFGDRESNIEIVGTSEDGPLHTALAAWHNAASVEEWTTAVCVSVDWHQGSSIHVSARIHFAVPVRRLESRLEVMLYTAGPVSVLALFIRPCCFPQMPKFVFNDAPLPQREECSRETGKSMSCLRGPPCCRLEGARAPSTPHLRAGSSMPNRLVSRRLRQRSRAATARDSLPVPRLLPINGVDEAKGPRDPIVDHLPASRADHVDGE
jgi:hypothetical protein